MKRRDRRRADRLLGLALLSVAVLAAVIASVPADRAPAPDADAIYRVELASYDKALAKWLRDSTVVDSVSRTIDTDTLYLLYRQMMAAPDSVVPTQEVACEEWRVGRRYHPLPSIAATRRLMDSLSRTEDPAAVRRLAARLTGLGRVRVGHWACGDPGEPRLAADVGGTSMVVSAERPTPPRPPTH